ncbi:sulfurtransferase TusA [Acinetobacter marinus]|nr:sulfurtransferase TusA [Acinetobacter marinus]
MTLPEQSTHQISKQLDTRGLRCPEPVMMLHQAIRKSAQGDVIEVLATDPSTSWDIPKFCMHLGHALLIQEEREFEGQPIYYYQVQKQ